MCYAQLHNEDVNNPNVHISYVYHIGKWKKTDISNIDSDCIRKK